MTVVDIDFETRSALDITKVGAWIYSKHESTDILCMFYSINHGEVKAYIPDETDFPFDLFEAINNGSTVVAHNAGFERSIWLNICVKKLGWPTIRPTQWKCSAAKAASRALPRNLGKLGRALFLPVVKDEEGKRVMLRLSKYRKPTKKDASTTFSREAYKPLYDQLYQYCATDVLSEIEVDKNLPDLTNYERTVWLLDQRMNFRGVPIDIEAVELFIKLLNEKKKQLLIELVEITEGEVETSRQVAKSLEWLAKFGYHLPNLRKDTVVTLLEKKNLPPKVRRFLEIRQNLGKSATDKYEAMNRTCDRTDNHIRDYLMYHGAATGRWAGKFVQFQNITRGELKNAERVIEYVKKCKDLETIEMMYGDIFKVASSCVRGMIKAPEGQKFMVADFSAIECRVLLWIADCQRGLDIFRNKQDIYKFMAQSIYGIGYDEVTSDQRFIGKTVILGCGYQMSPAKFLATCEGYKIDLNSVANREFVTGGMKMYMKSMAPEHEIKAIGEILAEKDLPLEEIKDRLSSIHIGADAMVSSYLVGTYRASNTEIVNLWRAMERAAVQTVLTGEPHECGKCIWHLDDRFLYCRLPSGRDMCYAYPKVTVELTSWGKEQYKLSYMSVDDRGNWSSTSTYGGKLVENVCQAISRDLMADAMIRSEMNDMPVVLTVHDELITLVKLEKNLKELVDIMNKPPHWAHDLPLASEGWEGMRYKK